MAPKRWGDRIEQIHTGDAGADPIKLLLEDIAAKGTSTHTLDRVSSGYFFLSGWLVFSIIRD
jgi:hypothetical protein